MQNLWKITNDIASNANYVDIFEISREKFGKCFAEWNDYIVAHANQLQINGSMRKCNQRAENLLFCGNRHFQNNNYRAAMQKYNECLCYAGLGSLWESLAYKHRAACFMKMDLYARALTDIHCAFKYKHTGRLLLQLRTLLAECQKMMTSIELIGYSKPQLNFPSNKDFPCLADVLEIRENQEFGRHIVAKRDIEGTFDIF